MKPPSTALTMLVCACLTAGLAIMFLIMPAVIRYQAAVAQQTKVSADNDQKYRQEQAAAKQAAALAAIRPQVLDLLPTSDLQYDLVVQIEGLARSLSIPLTSLSVTGAASPPAGAPAATAPPGSAAAGPPSVALNVGVTGTYAQIRQFVQALPTISRSLAITQLAISTAVATQKDTAASSNLVSAIVTASAFYQIPTLQKKT